MKNSILLLFLLLPVFLFAQFPNSGNKQRLGYQTTSDGLIFRGVAADTAYKPIGLNFAYFQLDTVNKVLRYYIATKGRWQVVGGSGTPTGAAGGDLTGTYPNPTLGLGVVISANVLDGTLVNADLASQTVDSNKIKNRAITNIKIAVNTIDSTRLAPRSVNASELVDASVTNAKIATNAVDSTKANNLSPNDLAQTGASTGQVLTWTGSKYAPRTVSSSNGAAYTSFQFILDTIPGTGITANESVANYEATKLDSARLKFSTLTKAGQRGGWLANGTSGDSIAVSVPFGVVIGDSQAEGHPALHGRLHPNGSGVFSYNYPDSTGQLSYHLTRLTKFPWVNQGLGGQTSESILKRIDRDVIGLTSAVGDGRPNKTLNRKPIICVIIAGINDVFGNYSANRTKANLSAMARKVSQAGIYCVMLTLPGDSIINNAPYVKTIEEINGWLRGGALNQYGTIICDYEKWWKDPAWNDLLHPKPGLIIDDIHPSKVGYDSLANFIVRETKMPVLHSVILHSENAQVSAVSGFSRVTSVRVGGSTFPMSAQVDSFLITTPLFLRDSAWYRVMASTSVTGTSFTGFNHIRYVFKNNVDRLNQRTRTNPPLSWVEIQGSTNTTGNSALIVRNLSGNPSLTVSDDGSVFNKGKNNIDANTFFGQEVAQGNVSGNGNSGFGQYALLSLTSGGNNSAFGERVLIVNSTGSSNSGFGNRALSRVTTGTGNVGIGTSAVGVTTGTNNSGVGSGVLGALTTGSENLGFGESALSTLTTGSQNTSLGTLSMFRAATSASENTTIGYRAAFEATAPTRSGFSGWNAGRYLANGTSAFQTMTNSMYYGALTKGSANGVTNENVFGYNATGSGSNTITLGDADVTDIYTGAETFRFSNGLRVITGSGSPESVVTAPVGSIYQNSAGSAGTTFYVKESGTGNTGWIGYSGTATGAAGGDLTGTYPNPTISNNAVTGAKVASQTLDSADVKNRGITLLKLAPSGATNAQVPKYNSASGNWEAAAVTQVFTEEYNTITSTSSPVTLSSTQADNLIDQGGTQATFTLNLPASPLDGQICTITYNNAITALTIDGNGNTIVGSAVTTGVAGSQRKFKFYTGIGWIKLY